jgi:hypothetical protein
MNSLNTKGVKEKELLEALNENRDSFKLHQSEEDILFPK